MIDLKLRKEILKMSFTELEEFLKNRNDKESILFEIANNPYFELYEDNKDLSTIILKDGKSLNLNFDDLKLDSDFYFEQYFTVIKKDKTCFQRKYWCSTKQIIYYRINEYLKDYQIFNDINNNKSTNKKIKEELKNLSKLKSEILNYIEKQKTIYKEFNQDNEALIKEVHSIAINDYQNNIYKNMLQDIRNTRKTLIKACKRNKRIATLKYKLFQDIKDYLKSNYEYQKNKIEREIQNLKNEIKKYSEFKEGLSQKKQNLEKLQYKLNSIPKDITIKSECFLNEKDLDLKIDSKNTNKYNLEYIFLYKIIED